MQWVFFNFLEAVLWHFHIRICAFWYSSPPLFPVFPVFLPHPHPCLNFKPRNSAFSFKYHIHKSLHLPSSNVNQKKAASITNGTSLSTCRTLKLVSCLSPWTALLQMDQEHKHKTRHLESDRRENTALGHRWVLSE